MHTKKQGFRDKLGAFLSSVDNMPAYRRMEIWRLDGYNTHYLDTQGIDTLNFKKGEKRFLPLNQKSKEDFIRFEVEHAGKMKVNTKYNTNIRKMHYILREEIFPIVFCQEGSIGQRILLQTSDDEQKIEDFRDLYNEDTLFGTLCATARTGDVEGFKIAYNEYKNNCNYRQRINDNIQTPKHNFVKNHIT